mmetsp:Transcript_25007/g.99368  ORF Transcript_25007/g.99368 Transcript_25007/m.99368 type:complete len:268 (+) Transcript_25007:34-837(+)
MSLDVENHALLYATGLPFRATSAPSPQPRAESRRGVRVRRRRRRRRVVDGDSGRRLARRQRATSGVVGSGGNPIRTRRSSVGGGVNTHTAPRCGGGRGRPRRRRRRSPPAPGERAARHAERLARREADPVVAFASGVLLGARGASLRAAAPRVISVVVAPVVAALTATPLGEAPLLLVRARREGIEGLGELGGVLSQQRRVAWNDVLRVAVFVGRDHGGPAPRGRPSTLRRRVLHRPAHRVGVAPGERFEGAPAVRRDLREGLARAF